MVLSPTRLGALLVKELLQLRRDRPSLAMILGIPLLQLLLFGFAINMNPRQLPTVVAVADPGSMARALVSAMTNSGYFRIVAATNDPVRARAMLQRGEATFVVEVPTGFSRGVVRGEVPEVLVEADATDPAAGSYALAAFNGLAQTALRDELTGPLAQRAQGPPPFRVTQHLLYNPESITQYNIVPGLLGIILTMTMVLLTCLSLTRERERGTYENLLAMPATPLEIMIGKIAPNVVIGALQSLVVLGLSHSLFAVPMLGSPWLLALALVVFIIANLAVGYTFSTVAQNQLQAMQMMVFFLLPSILLSGFAFPFMGMPRWAQAIGNLLPTTHFLRIVRGIMLKGSGWSAISGELGALGLFVLVVGSVALVRFRSTLD
jgi:ABC-2 type transport system permease protein